MEPRAHHVLIGLFTLAFSIAIVLFALWLAKSHQQGQLKHYEVIFHEPVRGLSQGNAVLYNGIRIGEVEDLRLDPGDLRQAHARIAIDANIPVRMDTQARLVLTGITGVSVIELSGGSPLSPLLVDPENGDPVIIATPSPLNQLLAGGDNLLTNLSELVLSANAMLSPENAERVSSILENMDVLSASLADGDGDFQTLLSELATASKDVRSAVAGIRSLTDSTQDLIAGGAKGVLDHAQGAMASLDRAAAGLSALVADSRQSIVSGVRGLNEVGPALQALRRTLVSIQDVVRRLDENPGRYLLGRDAIQEFEP